jgi:peptide/nickel transport system permease protein
MGEIIGYVKGIPTGKSFTYEYINFDSNMNPLTETRSYIEGIRPLFVYSVVNLVFAGSLALLSGTLVGLLLARSGGWIRDILEFLVTVPDFASAFFLQLLVVFIYKQTEVLVAEVFTTQTDTAYLLPFVTLFYLPFVYTVKQVSSQTYQVLTEDYILTAKAKGLGKKTIYVRHVLRNVLPLVQADLFRLSAIMTGNIIVIERLFNSPGVTRFLLTGEFEGQYAPQVNNLWTLVLIFLLTYGSMRIVIFGLKRGFAHD